MSVRYTKPGTQDMFGTYPDDDFECAPDPREFLSGSGFTGLPDQMITVEEPEYSTLGRSLVAMILERMGESRFRGPLLVTTEGWWTGYSEYTVTSTWETVCVTAPAHDYERHWPTVAALFAELGTREQA